MRTTSFILALTFILAGPRLITVRYDDPKPFSLIRKLFDGEATKC